MDFIAYFCTVILFSGGKWRVESGKLKVLKETNMKIGIIVAMDKELQQLKQLFNDENVRVEKCGIGKVNAALGAQRMINEFHPDVIVSSGCAGGNGDDM